MSKQKLTIENLAPYLPYGLKYFIDFEDGDTAVYEMMGLFADSGEVYLDGYETNLDAKNCKPILRPLSDLKHDYVFRELYFLIGGGYKSYETFKKSQLDNYLYTPPEMWSYRVLKLFLSLHVDLFGLIEKGLALNLNDLKDDVS